MQVSLDHQEESHVLLNVPSLESTFEKNYISYTSYCWNAVLFFPLQVCCTTAQKH